MSPAGWLFCMTTHSCVHDRDKDVCGHMSLAQGSAVTSHHQSGAFTPAAAPGRLANLPRGDGGARVRVSVSVSYETCVVNLYPASFKSPRKCTQIRILHQLFATLVTSRKTEGRGAHETMKTGKLGIKFLLNEGSTQINGIK